MESQGLSHGSIRNSHREIHAVKRKYAPASSQELARKLVESCSKDLVIRQRLDPQRVEMPLKKGSFYVMENEGRAEPGFIVFLPGIPPIFMQSRRGKDGQRSLKGNTLRMRVSMAVSEGGGSILVATLDDVLHTLRLEDVWMWKGAAIIQYEGFKKRREFLKEFVEYHWVPDARLLGGIFTSVAQPMSMEEFAEKKTWDRSQSVEFIPEMTGRRRMVWFLEAQVKAAEAHAGLKQARTQEVVAATATAAAAAAAPKEVSVKARLSPIDSLPDVYNLIGEDGLLIGRGAVQQFFLSRDIRQALQKGETWVIAKWNEEFNGYCVAELLSK
jgi:hypothetical protein